MAGLVQTCNVAARSGRHVLPDNDALRRLPRFIHQPLWAIKRNQTRQITS
jgi:hypothetical protein